MGFRQGFCFEDILFWEFGLETFGLFILWLFFRGLGIDGLVVGINFIVLVSQEFYLDYLLLGVQYQDLGLERRVIVV